MLSVAACPPSEFSTPALRRRPTHAAGLLERLCTGAEWSEGPVWLSETGSLLWSDIPNNHRLGWQPERGMSVWREAVEFTNGHAREADGALLHCSHGLRAIVRTRFTPAMQPLPDEVGRVGTGRPGPAADCRGHGTRQQRGPDRPRVAR